jgi:DNA replication initiation complex subunit (GINS family)
VVPLRDEAEVEARFGPFEDSVILMQDRCTVYIERTIGSKIILDTPDGAPR